MSIEMKRYGYTFGTLGTYLEFKNRVETAHRGFISRVPLENLKAEIFTREKELPFIQLVEQVMESAKAKGVEISPEKVIYDMRWDVLGRPELFIGYNSLNLSLEQILGDDGILDTDKKIGDGQWPGQTEAEDAIVWSGRFVISDSSGKVMAYASHPGNLQLFIDKFVEWNR